MTVVWKNVILKFSLEFLLNLSPLIYDWVLYCERLSYIFVLWFERNLFDLGFFHSWPFRSKTFEYEFVLVLKKKKHPTRTAYPINTAFWLVDFWVWMQNFYFKVLWSWDLEYWNFHTFIMKLQKRENKLYKQHSLIFFLYKNQHNMLPESAIVLIPWKGCAIHVLWYYMSWTNNKCCYNRKRWKTYISLYFNFVLFFFYIIFAPVFIFIGGI